MLKILFPGSPMAEPYVTKIISYVTNMKSIKQRKTGMCTVKLRHKDKCFKCTFFVVPGDGLALLGMSDIDLQSILRITCDIIGEPHESWN